MEFLCFLGRCIYKDLVATFNCNYYFYTSYEFLLFPVSSSFSFSPLCSFQTSCLYTSVVSESQSERERRNKKVRGKKYPILETIH